MHIGLIADDGLQFQTQACLSKPCIQGDKEVYLRRLSLELAAQGYGTVIRRATGGSAGNSCLSNLRHAFLVCKPAEAKPTSAEEACQQPAAPPAFRSVKLFRQPETTDGMTAWRPTAEYFPRPVGAPPRMPSGTFPSAGKLLAEAPSQDCKAPAVSRGANIRAAADAATPATAVDGEKARPAAAALSASSTRHARSKSDEPRKKAAAPAITKRSTAVGSAVAMGAGKARQAETATGTELIVDPFFKEQFKIAHATPSFSALLESMPAVFVGRQERLVHLVKSLCAGKTR